MVSHTSWVGDTSAHVDLVLPRAQKAKKAFEFEISFLTTMQCRHSHSDQCFKLGESTKNDFLYTPQCTQCVLCDTH